LAYFRRSDLKSKVEGWRKIHPFIFLEYTKMNYRLSNSFVEAFSLLPFLKSLDIYYPDFEHWYINKCIPGIVLGSDLLLIAENKAGISGVALAKKNKHEVKLRCLRVHHTFKSKGVGIHLIDKMLSLLDTDKPYCTVAEEMIHQYSRIFINRFHFQLSSVEKGKYRFGKLEYIFNYGSSSSSS
jgi:GNAT superfamily N-acetyltransferase